MAALRHALWLLMTLPCGSGAPREFVCFVSSRDVILTYTPAAARPVRGVVLWVTHDDGASWSATPTSRISAQSIGYHAAEDGRIGFHLVLENEAGVSGAPPAPGTRPRLVVVVDTVPPTLQLHSVRVRSSTLGPEIVVGATVIDENLGPSGLRLFYRGSGSEPWHDGGNVRVAEGTITWPLPAGVAGPIDVRVVATDLAGNQAADEVTGVAGAQGGEEEAWTGREAREDLVPVTDRVLPVVVAPALATCGQAAEPDESGRSTEARHVDVFDTEQLAFLRRTGLQALSERRYGIAAQRLAEAARLAPDDVELLTGLGNALYRTQQFDDADARFAAAASARPDYLPALEGRALVAVTQRRYADAREHLLSVLRIAPTSAANWLRYGDVEQRLGSTAQALDAWRKVVELKEADVTLRSKANQRLRYFAPDRRQR